MAVQFKQTRGDLSRFKQFFSDELEKVLYIIETGFLNEENRFLVVHEDAYQQELGKTELLSKNDIISKYGIEI